MVHLHLHIIRIKGTLGWVVSGTWLVGRIWHDRSVVGASTRIPNNHMTLFEVLNKSMEIV